MTKPKRLRIGPVKYKVREVPLNEDYGNYDEDNLEILIQEKLLPQLYTITLWHEIIHGILVHCGIPTGEHDEKVIDAVANGIYQVLEDNPIMREL